MDLRTIYGCSLLALTALRGLLVNCHAQDVAIGHFNSTNYGDWTTTGTAFNLGPAADGLLAKLEIENARDNRARRAGKKGR